MDAYIVGGYRSAIGKAPRGSLRFTRPDDIAAAVIKRLLKDFPQIEKSEIDDIVVGNAFPEAESGMNMGRFLSLMTMESVDVPGSTVNRFCSSGIETIAIASSKITAGIADIIIAGGAESMSMINIGGWRLIPNPKIAKTNPNWFLNMGLTSEMVSREYKLSRQQLDEFAANSYQKAFNALDNGYFKEQIAPITIRENYYEDGKMKTKESIFDTDECPRRGTTLEGLAKLKPAFSLDGSSTAGNSSQMSDGAGFVLIVSEKTLKRYNLTPIARLVDYQVAGVDPYKMGVGPMKAIPKVLKHAGMNLNDIDLIELMKLSQVNH